MPALPRSRMETHRGLPAHTCGNSRALWGPGGLRPSHAGQAERTSSLGQGSCVGRGLNSRGHTLPATGWALGRGRSGLGCLQKDPHGEGRVGFTVAALCPLASWSVGPRLSLNQSILASVLSYPCHLKTLLKPHFPRTQDMWMLSPRYLCVQLKMFCGNQWQQGSSLANAQSLVSIEIVWGLCVFS